mmetsp:Transcript_14712/g.45591  ORF Transcript_14712/g.45591 Transcript_14712/m.45591 type:complete len:207 (+) Transcript_14712:549-1169(+)
MTNFAPGSSFDARKPKMNGSAFELGALRPLSRDADFFWQIFIAKTRPASGAFFFLARTTVEKAPLPTVSSTSKRSFDGAGLGSRAAPSRTPRSSPSDSDSADSDRVLRFGRFAGDSGVPPGVDGGVGASSKLLLLRPQLPRRLPSLFAEFGSSDPLRRPRGVKKARSDIDARAVRAQGSCWVWDFGEPHSRLRGRGQQSMRRQRDA